MPGTITISITADLDTPSPMERRILAALLDEKDVPTIVGTTILTPTPIADLYFPTKPGDALYPSPAGSRIVRVGTDVQGKSFLLDKRAAIHTLGTPTEGKAGYFINGAEVTAYGGIKAVLLVEGSDGEVYVQLEGGYIQRADPNMGNGLYPATIPEATTTAAPVQAATPAAPVTPGNADTVLTVGTGRAYATVADAIHAANAGAGGRIAILAGTYAEVFPANTVPLIIEGVGGLAVFDGAGLTASLSRGKGLIVPCADTTLRNIKVINVARDQEGAQGTAAVRPDGGCNNLTLDGCELADNQFGVFTGGDLTIQVMVKDSKLHGNGLPAGNSGNGLAHNIYTGKGTYLVLDGTDSTAPLGGHAVKNRGPSTSITGGSFDATDATILDQPDGGALTVKDATLTKPAGSANHGVLGYAMESAARGTPGATVTGGVIDAECDNPLIQGRAGTTVTLDEVTMRGTKPRAEGVTVNGL